MFKKLCLSGASLKLRCHLRNWVSEHGGKIWIREKSVALNYVQKIHKRSYSGYHRWAPEQGWSFNCDFRRWFIFYNSISKSNSDIKSQVYINRNILIYYCCFYILAYTDWRRLCIAFVEGHHCFVQVKLFTSSFPKRGKSLHFQFLQNGFCMVVVIVVISNNIS